MNLEIFTKIDNIVKYYEQRINDYEKLSLRIKRILEDLILTNSMYSLSVVYRVKTPDSVREKMIKNSCYRKYDSVENAIDSFKDIIGLRIDCKFMEDESYVYDLIKMVFAKTDDFINYYNENAPEILLNLSESQPQKQKNGFDIYKIDCLYVENGKRTNFELQIKSLVNNFWGDIEHKIIYKNNSYIVMDDLVLDNMRSIKENLNLIDKQLHQLYGRYKREDNFNSRMRYKSIDAMLSKMIHDVFAGKMRSKLGFVTDFKSCCDSIIQYLLVVNNATNMEDYSKVVFDVFYTINQISKNDIEFNETLELDEGIDFQDDTFCNTIYQTILKLINEDFQWHLYFLILFNIEKGKREVVLENFIRYYKGQFLANGSFGLLYSQFEYELIDIIKKDLIDEMSSVFRKRSEIDLINKKGMSAMNSALSRVLEEISIQGQGNLDWDIHKGKYLSKLNNYMINS